MKWLPSCSYHGSRNLFSAKTIQIWLLCCNTINCADVFMLSFPYHPYLAALPAITYFSRYVCFIFVHFDQGWFWKIWAVLKLWTLHIWFMPCMSLSAFVCTRRVQQLCMFCIASSVYDRTFVYYAEVPMYLSLDFERKILLQPKQLCMGNQSLLPPWSLILIDCSVFFNKRLYFGTEKENITLQHAGWLRYQSVQSNSWPKSMYEIWHSISLISKQTSDSSHDNSRNKWQLIFLPIFL